MEASDFPISLKSKNKREQNFWLSTRGTQMWNYQKFQFLASFNKYSKHELNLLFLEEFAVVPDLLGVIDVAAILWWCKVSIKQQEVQSIQPVYNPHFKLFLLWRQKWVPIVPLARRFNSSHPFIMILLCHDCLYSGISITSFKPSWLLSDTKETIQFHMRISWNSISLFHGFSLQQEKTICVISVADVHENIRNREQ